jgi:hypothetical protein
MACGIPCFAVAFFGSFVDDRIIVKAGRAGKPDNVPVSCPYNLVF